MLFILFILVFLSWEIKVNAFFCHSERHTLTSGGDIITINWGSEQKTREGKQIWPAEHAMPPWHWSSCWAASVQSKWSSVRLSKWDHGHRAGPRHMKWYRINSAEVWHFITIATITSPSKSCIKREHNAVSNDLHTHCCLKHHLIY